MLLATVALTMASSCWGTPEPTPDPGPVPEPEPEISAERKAFEESSAEGLYMKGSCVFAYDAASQQRASNEKRKTMRMQSDDQTRYVHLEYSGNLPKATGDESSCTIHYNLADEGETMLIVKLMAVKSTDSRLWLWNELQKVGVIVPYF